MLEQNFHIAELIARFLAETIQPKELQELENWRNAAAEHEALFQRLCDQEYMKQQALQRKLIDKQKGWLEVERRIQRAQRRVFLWKVSRYAALLLIPLIIGTVLFNRIEEPAATIVQTASHRNNQILPGEKKAILTLDNGQIIDLKASKNILLEEKDGTAIQVDSSTLNYQSSSQAALVSTEKIAFNKIEIPRGGEYSLFLSDGTKVYLNSMSSLRFPVQFKGAKRVVELQGEAYFEVCKNGKPFIVKTLAAEVEVLGTTFNISAYQGEEYQATLLSGSVKVHTEEISRLLKPSEQARIAPGGTAVAVQRVDAHDYTSWINGKIHFKDRRLEEIMHSLSRWYDMTVVYQNERVKNLKFGCNLDRDKEITPFLKLLENTGKVSVTINERIITIK